MNKKEIYNDLESAIGENNVQQVFEILSKNPSLNLDDGDFMFNPPLYRASQLGFKEICKILINKGAKINYTKDNVFYPLEGASSTNKVEIMRLLLENGADINSYEITVLSAIGSASSEDSYEAVKYLIEQGADINRISIQRYLTPLDLSIMWHNEKTISLLKSHNALSNINRDYNWSQEAAGGISAHIDEYIGRVIPNKFCETEDGVFYRLAMVNKEKNILLFSVGNYKYTKPHTEFMMVLPLGWNPYSLYEKSIFPYQVMKMLTIQIKNGVQFKDGDYISKNSKGFDSLTWIDTIIGFYIIDYNYTDNKIDDGEDTVHIYTLFPVKENKNGCSRQSLEKLKSKKWKGLEIPGINVLKQNI